MVKLTKIYTRTGDAGDTQLANGDKVKKTSLRMHSIGDVDELNSWIGHCIVAAEAPIYQPFTQSAEDIQQTLFNLGAELAIPPEARRPDSPAVTQANINALETNIDNMNRNLPPLTSFILPGGNELSSRLHIARSLCRRAERSLFALHDTQPLNPLLLAYLNRLSDWLFVAARHVCHIDQTPETLWQH